jgi:prepilin-type N-terminal cleavage/methylation domain-containing protein/prepilin-type processing-associated H-X9-DG protein
VGFTIVELLVAIAVIAVLIALTTGSLAQARKAGQAAVCLSTISQWGIEATNLAKPGRETWPNAWDYPELLADKDLASIEYDFTYGVDYTGQAAVWHGPFLVNGWAPAVDASDSDVRRPDRACPRLGAVLPEAWDGVRGALASYMYSVALVTHPDLWDPAHPDRRTEPREWGRSVRISDVRFPSHKSVFFEKQSFHGDGRMVWDNGVRPVHVAFADGHASLVSTQDASPSLPYVQKRAEQSGLPLGMRIPFNASAGGVKGVDRVLRTAALP